MPEMTSDKTALRRTLIANRQAIAPEVRSQWDAAIGAAVIDCWDVQQVQILGVYWPVRGEPDLRAVYVELFARGVQLALPVVVGRDQPLQFASWRPGDALVKGALGMAVPADAGKAVEPDALLVPCVGFNADRFRLGYGGGFYDRTLASHPRPLAVGIAYGCGLVEFDGAPHDIALDQIITELSAPQG
jgi:5,10-methenyltetrahydrofolate synthetase